MKIFAWQYLYFFHYGLKSLKVDYVSVTNFGSIIRHTLDKSVIWGVWLALSLEHTTLDLEGHEFKLIVAWSYLKV